MLMTIAVLLVRGIGIWGNNIPVAWAFDIINFVWWIGIGHAGTLISAILSVAAPAVAYVDQPVCRGDDAVRGRVRRACTRAARRPAVARLLAVPVPEHDGRVAELP
jgi:hypothetical protein